MDVTTTTVGRILTRASGYVAPVASHTLQPYGGCALGNSLCGIGCYVRGSWFVTRGREWGGYVEVRANAAEAYRAESACERKWAGRSGRPFGIFMSSATEPFQPAERKYHVTRSVLEAMIERPPDVLIVQSHSHHVADYLDLYPALAKRCDLRFHVSIESDRDRLPGLPPPASSVEKRLAAASALKAAGLRVVATLSPLHPIDNPDRFFARLARTMDAIVIDHFITGDGTPTGARTLRTAMPLAMAAVEPASVTLAYRDRIVEIARQHMPGRVGVGVDGFAGIFLPAARAPVASAAG